MSSKDHHDGPDLWLNIGMKKTNSLYTPSYANLQKALRLNESVYSISNNRKYGILSSGGFGAATYAVLKTGNALEARVNTFSKTDQHLDRSCCLFG